MKQRVIQRWMAVFFLVFTSADLCGLLPCCDQFACSHIGSKESCLPADADCGSQAVVAPDCAADEPADVGDDQCQCCCTTILSEWAQINSPLKLRSFASAPSQTQLPSSPLPGTFHPPRLA